MVGNGMLTVGDLARHTGMSPKLIRRLTDLGLIYSPGRSSANYRQYDESAMWCVQIITELRTLGLTIDEIEKLADAYLHGQDGEASRLLDDMIDDARARVTRQMAQLEEMKTRLEHVRAGSVLESLAASDPTRS